jgi:NitT/TauT family transport system substrate-binding protein
MSGLYLAKEQGYFSDLGLQVEVEKTAHSSHAIPLASNGKLDVVFGSLGPSLVNAIARGSRLRIVAGRDFAAPGCCDLAVLYGRRELFPNGLSEIGLLRGKRVGANLRMGMSEFCVETILKSAQINKEELDLINIGRSELIVAFLSGKLDAVFLSDFTRRFETMTDHIVRGISIADVIPNYMFSFISFGARLLDGDPDIGTRFLSAYLRGVSEFVAGKTPRFHDELALSNGFDPEKARNACRNNFVVDGRIDLPCLDRFIQWAAAKEYCLDPIPAEQLVDMRFLERMV